MQSLLCNLTVAHPSQSARRMGHPRHPSRTLRRVGVGMFVKWDEHMSYRRHRVPPLQRTQGRGTHSRIIGEETKTEGRATRQYPQVKGSSWTVAGGDVAGNHNYWGYDNVGYLSSTGPAYIRSNGPAHGVSIPCTQTLYQNMFMYCNGANPTNYINDTLTITVNQGTSVTNCRAGVCSTINGY